MRKESWKKYFRSDDQLMDVIDFLPDPTMIIDMEGCVVMWNIAMEELTGVKAEDILGRGNYEYAIPFYKERRPILVDLVLASDSSIEKGYPSFSRKRDAVVGEGYVPGIRDGGACLWGVAKPLYGKNGEIIGAIESIRDITDLKETSETVRKQRDELKSINDEFSAAMENLKEINREYEETNRQLAETREELLKTNELLKFSEEKFSKAFRGSPTVISISTVSDGRYIDVSDSFYEATGYTREEVIGHTAFELNIWADLSDRERILKEMKERGSVRDLEMRFRGKDGEIRIKLFSADIIVIQGEPCLLAVNADITERKRSEETIRKQKDALERVNSALTETLSEMNKGRVRLEETQSELIASNERLKISEEKFSKTVHLGPVIITLSRVDDGRYVEVSDYFLKLTGYTREEVLGHTSIELNIWGDIADREQVMSMLKNDGVVKELDILFRSRHGDIFTMRYSAEIVTIAGEPHLISVAVDITERIRAEKEKESMEQQLAQSQKMETVGRLAGGIAHDFNNLLTAIMGNVEICLMRGGAENPCYHNLETIKKASESAADLTKRILTFSRKQIIEPKAMNLNSMLEQMQRLLERLIGEDIKLETIPAAEKGEILADTGQIEQILVNLSVNARDAMPQGGKLTLETANVTLDEHYCRNHAYAVPGEYVMLSVSDTGTGMSDEVKKHLFEPFFTTKPKGRGTGLGLSMVYGAVRQNKGTIEVYSVEGKGTSFKMYFPLSGCENISEDGICVDESPKSGHETVLIVEDSPLVLDFSVNVLEEAGYRVLEADSGEEGSKTAASYKGEIDLLITDVVLPGINGKALAEKIQKQRPGIKVLYTSGYTENFIVQQDLAKKGVSFIGKPYSAHSFLKKIREILDSD